MKLLIDFGNSRCKWANLDNQVLLNANVCTYKNDSPSGRVREIVEQLSFDSIQEIHAASVLGNNFDKEFSIQADKLTGISTNFYVSQPNCFGVTLAYDDPLSYGADRYAALIAAYHKTSGAKIVIDCGTATTVDVIDANGNHLGGLIIPGIDLMCSSLANKASGIIMPQQSSITKLFNDNTADAVYSGSVLVLSHGVCGIVKKIMNELNQLVTVFVTGGESNMINFEDIEFEFCPNLVLEGLRIMQG